VVPASSAMIYLGIEKAPLSAFTFRYVLLYCFFPASSIKNPGNYPRFLALFKKQKMRYHGRQTERMETAFHSFFPLCLTGIPENLLKLCNKTVLLKID